jgi:hypothetical protein
MMPSSEQGFCSEATAETAFHSEVYPWTGSRDWISGLFVLHQTFSCFAEQEDRHRAERGHIGSNVGKLNALASHEAFVFAVRGPISI